jgi:hypothetical protein
VRSAQYVVGDGTCMMRREGKGKERGEEKRREEKISQGEREKKEETSFVYMPQVFLSSFTSFSYSVYHYTSSHTSRQMVFFNVNAHISYPSLYRLH